MKPSLPQHNPTLGIANGEVYRLRCPMKLEEFRTGDTAFIGDQKFLREFIKIQDITLVSPHRCYHLWKNAQRCKKLKGDFAQVGVYKGGSAKLIAEVLGKSKPFWLFDTFKGLPSHSGVDGFYKGDFSDVSLSTVSKLFKENSGVRIIKGLFPQTAVHVPTSTQFAFVYLDVDLYEWNKQALEYFYPRMVRGGMMMIDDYGEKHLKGIRKSTDEIFANKREKPEVTTVFQCKIQF